MKTALLKQFWKFVNERHAVYLKKTANEPKPWTKDPILQQGKFTNVFPYLDATSRVLYSIVKHHGKKSKAEDVITNVVAFRFFNNPDTYHDLVGSMHTWASGWLSGRLNKCQLLTRLQRRVDRGDKIFTGAYVNTVAFNSQSNYGRMIDTVVKVSKDAPMIVEAFQVSGFKTALQTLSGYDLIGEFTANMILRDLIHLGYYVSHDSEEWIWLGPGAIRGLNRLQGRGLEYGKRRMGLMQQFSDELNEIKATQDKYRNALVPPLKLHDIEHSLCEFDKYLRIKLDGKRPWRKYNGTS